MTKSLAGFVACAFAMLATLGRGGTLTVINANDNLAGSLRQMIQDANPGDTIVFKIPGAVAQNIVLTSGELVIAKDLTITGAGSQIKLQRSSAANTPLERIFTVTGGNVTLDNLTIADGFPNSPKGTAGGGVFNSATLTLRNCTLTNNRSGGFSGGGIYNTGTLSVINCTITKNLGGGGIINTGTLAVANTTITENNGAANGGGINTSTIVKVRNTVIAKNAGGNPEYDVSGAFASEGYNFIGDVNGSTGFGGSGSHDQLGTRDSLADPKLGVLQDNGGWTQTQLPLAGSPLIDQGNTGLDVDGQPIGTDQRGYLRPDDNPAIANTPGGDGSDIGAVEVGVSQTGPTFTVTTTLEHFDGQCTGNDCTLVEAVARANADGGAHTINFLPGLHGSIGTSLVTPGGLTITVPLTINGPGARTLTVTARRGGRVFRTAASNVNISGLDIRNGQVTDNGGAISNTGGLTLTDCHIFNSFSTAGTNAGFGGGIYNASGATLTLLRCTLDGNNASQAGGGVYNDGTVTATNCTFSNDNAINGGGIYSSFNNNASKVTLRNCTITQCNASDPSTATGAGGGGIFAQGNDTQYFLGNTLFAGNTSTTNPDVRGNFHSDGHNLIGKAGFSTGLTNGNDGDQIGNGAGIDPKLDATLRNNGGPTDTHALLSGSTAIDGGSDTLAPPRDQRGRVRAGVSDIGAYEFGGTLPVTLANISTRLSVQGGDNALIGGFIVTGTQPKTLIVRGIGPSLPVNGPLADPTLEVYDGGGALIANNDNWQTNANAADIQNSGVSPSDGAEAAVLGAVNPGAYTAVERGANSGTGIGLLDLFDLDRTVDSKLANISTRGLVQSGDDVMIGGFIVLGVDTQKVIVRAIGPSLPLDGALPNPTLELRDENGDLVRANNDWQSDQAAEIAATGVPPSNPLEAAVVATLAPAAYTAVVRDSAGNTGIGLVEVYALEP